MFIRTSAFCLSKHEASAMLAFASDDETRRRVYGVGFFPAQGRAVATNGHHIAELSSHDGATADEGAPFIVPRPPLAMAAKVCGARGVLSIVNGEIALYEDETILPGAGFELATFAFESPAGEAFPDYEATIPSRRGDPHTAALALNPADLALLATVAKACELKTVILHVPEDQDAPILMTIEEWRIVTMPMKAEPAKGAAEKAAKK